MNPRTKQAPRNCPVCGEILALTRLSCDECGTELGGHFPTCDYCSLESDDRETLRVFLSSRGNMKELERHLGVSYPTARARFDTILTRLGFEAAPEEGEEDSEKEPAGSSLDVLDSLAKGDIGVEEALKRLS